MGAELRRWVRTAINKGEPRTPVRVFRERKSFREVEPFPHISPEQKVDLLALAETYGLGPRDTTRALRIINNLAGEATIRAGLPMVGRNIIKQIAKEARERHGQQGT